MKAFARVGGVIVAVLVLIAIVPNAVRVPTSRSEQLTVSVPPTPSFSETIPLASELPTPLPVAAPLPIATLAPVDVPSPTATLNRTRVAPTSDDRLIEMRLVRSALAAQSPGHADSSVTWDVFVHLPPNAAQRTPLRVLLALHGIGGNGPKFAASLISEADKNGWVLVAPTLPYQHDYLDPDQLMQEDLDFGHILHSLLDALPGRLGLKLRQHALIFGFSRGAQLGHRFALFHPEHVETVATISAGSYTLPLAKNNTQPLKFPFGIADLAQRLGEPLDLVNFQKITFWIAVGKKDNRTADVSRAFDSSTGKNRVERAQAFDTALRSLGMDVRLTIYPNADHEVTSEMRDSALRFLREDELADHWND